MKTVVGKWRLNNGREINVERDVEGNEEGYCGIIESASLLDFSHLVTDCLYYNDKGKCYRDKRLVDSGLDIIKDSSNENDFASWDLKELIEEKVEIVPLKRNSNPIFMLDVFTE